MFFETPSVDEARTTVRDACLDQEALEAYVESGVVLDFDGCSFPGVRFDGLTLKDWNFFGCDLDAVSFAGARLENVRWLGCNARNASFRGARLTHVRISESALPFSDWDASALDDAVFDAVDFHDAWFSEARLDHVAIFDCQLNGVDLQQASLSDTQMENYRQNVHSAAGASVSGVIRDTVAGSSGGSVLHGQEAN